MDPAAHRGHRRSSSRPSGRRRPACRGRLPGDRRLERDRLRAAVPRLGRPAPRADAEPRDERAGGPRLRRQGLQGRPVHPAARPQSGRRATGRYYVHSHGDYYWHPADQRRYSGFREDSGDCNQSVVYSKDIKDKRAGRATNLVVISTCFNGDANTTMPGAFGIAKTKAGELDWNGPRVLPGLPRRGLSTTTRRRSRSPSGTPSRRARASARRSTWRCSSDVHPCLLRRRLVGQLHLVRAGRARRHVPVMRVGGDVRCPSCSTRRSFASVGGPAAVLLLLLGARCLLVTGLARPADATDPVRGRQRGHDRTRRPVRGNAATVRAAAHERVLGLAAATRRTVDRVVDRRGQRTYDEVTDLDAAGRPVAVLRYALDGRLVAATQLGWRPGPGRPLAGGPGRDGGGRSPRPLGRDDPRRHRGRRAARHERLVGPLGPGRRRRARAGRRAARPALAGRVVPRARRRPSIRWRPGRRARSRGRRPRRPWAGCSTAGSRRRIAASARIASAALAWVAPNDTFEPARPDAPADVRRLAWVVFRPDVGSARRHPSRARGVDRRRRRVTPRGRRPPVNASRRLRIGGSIVLGLVAGFGLGGCGGLVPSAPQPSRPPTAGFPTASAPRRRPTRRRRPSPQPAGPALLLLSGNPGAMALERIEPDGRRSELDLPDPGVAWVSGGPGGRIVATTAGAST